MSARPPPVDVRFTNVTYSIPSTVKPLSRKRTPPTPILRGVSAYVRAGESLAILGPSGSGKTSLLNVLAARTEHPLEAGTVRFAGRRRVPRTKRHIGYVMQDDVFFSKLTVRETLQFTADIRLPDTVSKHDKRAAVDDVMHSLRLTKCQHTRIGDQQFDKGISGGERKRVNIANELLHSPSLLLADECTSGLDSSSAYTVINLLRQLCEEGRTVIATIHQPSSQMFALFDHILLLAAGRVAYFGPPAKVVEYFQGIGFPFPTHAYNPADYILELVIDDRTDPCQPDIPSVQQRILTAWETDGPQRMADRHLIDMQARSDDEHAPPGNLPQVSPDKYPTNWFSQVFVLGQRALRQKRGVLLEPIYIAQLVLVAFIVSMCWFRIDAREGTIEDRLGVLSFMPIFWAFYSTFNALFAFPAEKQILNKDRAGGSYRLSAYYFAKTMIETPADTVYPLFFAAATYFIVGLNPFFLSFLLFTIVLVLNVLTAQSVGLFISAVVMDVRHAQIVGSIWVLTSMLTAGYYIDPDNVPPFVLPFRVLSFIKVRCIQLYLFTARPNSLIVYYQSPSKFFFFFWNNSFCPILDVVWCLQRLFHFLKPFVSTP
ncbi:unnamed protein product [Chondrus crispus]|uniref:Probable ATP-dependent transporter ycf16 n=1 Tax=Chondrus crispus TaxID=2769 RepID=R7Q994_CHOCR|nr:unnamed protein product [Chondrus crispus]CDF34030.1 unnamed protein product [Chondrus crispus]|eukprot:XP_005713849.1 unnamed protein product [Chondrus crispus]